MIDFTLHQGGRKRCSTVALLRGTKAKREAQRRRKRRRKGGKEEERRRRGIYEKWKRKRARWREKRGREGEREGGRKMEGRKKTEFYLGSCLQKAL
jgi:hypothetical protein